MNAIETVAAATQCERREAWLGRVYVDLVLAISPDAIQRSDGAKTGKGYSTTGYGYQWIVDRFNVACGLGGWRMHTFDWTIEEYQSSKGRDMYATTVGVRIELGERDEAGIWIVLAERECYGNHDASTLGDAKKGAITNGLKKVAAMYGCGAAAFRDEIDDDNKPRPEEERRRAPRSRRAESTNVSAGEVQRSPIDDVRQAAKAQVIALANRYGSDRCALITKDMPRRTAGDFEAMAKRIESAVSIDVSEETRDCTVDDYETLRARAAMSVVESLADLRSTYNVEHANELDRDQLNSACRRLEIAASREDNDVPI